MKTVPDSGIVVTVCSSGPRRPGGPKPRASVVGRAVGFGESTPVRRLAKRRASGKARSVTSVENARRR